MSENEGKHRKVIIIGSGPAAHVCAIYTGRALLQPLMFEGFYAGNMAAGGQLTTTTDVENFPGFPNGINGGELMEKMREQSINCGCDIITETIDKVDLSKRPFLVGTENGDAYTCDALVISTGATAKRMNIPGEERLWNNGVSACAVCDGAAPLFRNKPIVVIGGGDSACEEAVFLTKYAKVVYVLVRRDVLRASKVMAKKLLNNDSIRVFFNTVATSVTGTSVLEKVHIKNVITGEESSLDASGLFYAIGHVPNTQFLENQVSLDSDGYIITTPDTKTSVPGVFACGDCQDKKYRQAITAAGSGCVAALEVEHYLRGDI